MTKKETKTARMFGTASKAEIFEQLIEKVLGKRVKLIPISSEVRQQRGEIYYGNCKKED